MVKVVDSSNFDGIRRAAVGLRTGAVVLAQTDTNYGIFCDPFSEQACHRLYEMKGREATKPLTLFISAPDDWLRWVWPPEADVEALTRRLWPGPLNLIFKKKGLVPDWVTSGMDTVSVVHNTSVVINLLAFFSGLPLAATSANLSGTMDSDLVTFDLAMDHVGANVDIAIRGNKPSEFSKSSTIVSLVGQPKIVRQGDISAEALREFLPELLL